jgi:hypothetical protein
MARLVVVAVEETAEKETAVEETAALPKWRASRSPTRERRMSYTVTAR